MKPSRLLFPWSNLATSDCKTQELSGAPHLSGGQVQEWGAQEKGKEKGDNLTFCWLPNTSIRKTFSLTNILADSWSDHSLHVTLLLLPEEKKCRLHLLPGSHSHCCSWLTFPAAADVLSVSQHMCRVDVTIFVLFLPSPIFLILVA